MITLFWNGPFSQWYPSEFLETSILDSKKYRFKNCEQYMMFNKAIVFNDRESASKILGETNPKLIKQYGRQVKNYNETKWSQIKELIVYKGNLAKFTQNSDLAKKLLDTGNSIIAEASPYDKIWGIGLSENDPKAQVPNEWKGENLLGKALMKVRDTLRGICYQCKKNKETDCECVCRKCECHNCICDPDM